MSILREFLKKSEDKRIKIPVKAFLDQLGENGVKLIQNWGDDLAIIDKIIDNLEARGLRKQLLDSELFFGRLLAIANSENPIPQILGLELVNKLAASVGKSDRPEFLRKKFNGIFEEIAPRMLRAGDYEQQIIILELFMRYKVREDQEAAIRYFGESRGKAFSKMSRKSFESDARPFLNEINEKNPRISSLPCHRAVVGARQIQPPSAEGYKSLWVDFQLGSKQIRIYCKLDYSLDKGEGKWDSLVIHASEVLNYDVVEGAVRNLLRITVSKEVFTMFDVSNCSQFPGREIKLEFQKNLPVRQCMERLCQHLSVTSYSHSQASEDVFDGNPKPVSRQAFTDFRVALYNNTPKA